MSNKVTNMELTIKKATAADAQEIAQVHMRSWETAYAGIIPDEFIREKNKTRPALWQQILSGDNDRHYIIRLGDRAAGIMSVAPPQDEDLGDSFYELHGLYLHPDFIGRGVGAQAMDYALDLARSLGKKTMVVYVLKENTAARRFYQRCGFTCDGAQKQAEYGKTFSIIRYRREI